MGFGKQEGVDNWQLSGADRPSEPPVDRGGFRNIPSGGHVSVSVKSVVLGKIQVLSVFVIYRIPRNGMWVDEGEGFDRKRLLDRGIVCGLCELVSMDGQH
jgi:hypothetical protein